jgi:sugar phosphate isomerase/epimerase
MQGDEPTWSRPVRRWGSMMREKRVRIGNQTALSAKRLTEPFEYAVENGFDAFEWFLAPHGMDDGWEEAGLAPEERREVGRTAAENDIKLSVHVPWWLDPFEPEGYEHLARSLEFAMDMGARNLNMHLSSERGIEAFEKTLSPVLRRLAGLPIRLSIENIPSSTPEEFNELFTRFADAGIDVGGLVGMCLDLGHANLSPLTTNDYLGFIDRLAPHVPIVHLHLHENYGDDDTHIPLFSGPSERDPSGIKGFVDRMKRRGFSGCGILEMWPDPPSLLNQARDRLLRMFNSTGGAL